MKLSTVQQLVLEALADGKHRTRKEIQRAGHIKYPVLPVTMAALIRHGLVEVHVRLDPTTYTITQDGLSWLEAHNNKKGL
ncbi:MAG: hypothetical protein ACIAQF_05120 [Phycisphaerales bacterium JB065]